MSDLDQLSDGLKCQLRRDLAIDHVFLGIRFNPTNMRRSALINSLELADHCIEFAKQALVDYGEINYRAQVYTYSNDFM